MFKYEELVIAVVLIILTLLKVGSIIALYATHGHTDGFQVNHPVTTSFIIQQIRK